MAARQDSHADSFSFPDVQPNSLPPIDEDLVDLTGPDTEIPETQLPPDLPLSDSRNAASAEDMAKEIESSASTNKRKRRIGARDAARKQPRRDTPKPAVVNDEQRPEPESETIISTLTREVALVQDQLHKEERAIDLSNRRISELERQTSDLKGKLEGVQEIVDKLEKNLDRAIRGNKDLEVTILVLSRLLNSGDGEVDPVSPTVDD